MVKIKFCILHFTFCILLMGCVKDKPPQGGDIRVGDKLPQFAVMLNDGRDITTKSLEGKVSLIIFFTTYCPDCQAQLPIVDEIYETYKDNEEVIIFAISREQGEDIVSPYWSENNLRIPYSAQESRDIYALFARQTVPRIYISDRRTIVRKITTDNPLATYSELRTAIDEIVIND